ncbi:MAG: GNAT family N-acetyltransferase [Pseudomonadota bacterium]
MKIRPTASSDIPALQLILKDIELFPADMLPDLASGFLSGGDHDSRWLTCEEDGTIIGFCYAVQEQLAEGAWNMLAIGVRADRQGCGAGTALVEQLETDLRDSGQRILIADTSGTADFARTRQFYRNAGYSEEARIRDFWADGDDKVTFRKAL